VTFCALANARSIPIAASIQARFQDLDELHDIGDIALHISGCINSCGHHHSGHIGVLGVDKDGLEWYQVSVGGSDGATLGGPAVPGKVIGPSFAADEVTDVIEALVATYLDRRVAGERFIHTARRIGVAPFRQAADAVRHSTADTPPATDPGRHHAIRRTRHTLAREALVLDNTQDVLARADEIRRHACVVLQFPKWTDGRAYSQAVLLRGRLAYAGTVMASGQVLADMLPLLRRCGFDAVQLRADQQQDHARRALGYFDTHYQTVPAERRAPATR
jgi:uncharacterized protein (DUF934 family)